MAKFFLLPADELPGGWSFLRHERRHKTGVFFAGPRDIINL
jgi:hypothetical protein